MEDTRRDINKILGTFSNQGQYEAMLPHILLAAAMLEYMARVQEVQAALEPEEPLIVETNQDDEPGVPDYQAYAVDSEVVHTLHEDFTFTRPAAFEFTGQRHEARTWQQMLVKTCEILLASDPPRFAAFEDDPSMRGRKQKRISMNPDLIRKPERIKDSSYYVETNLSANDIRYLIIKMLRKYDYKITDFKVFLRADYTSLH